MFAARRVKSLRRSAGYEDPATGRWTLKNPKESGFLSQTQSCRVPPEGDWRDERSEGVLFPPARAPPPPQDESASFPPRVVMNKGGKGGGSVRRSSSQVELCLTSSLRAASAFDHEAIAQVIRSTTPSTAPRREGCDVIKGGAEEEETVQNIVAKQNPDFVCPIGCSTMSPMRDPVTASDGHTYEAEEIEKWMAIGMLRTRGEGPITSPVTGAALESSRLYPNHALRRLIQRAVAVVEEEVKARSKAKLDESSTASIPRAAGTHR